MNLIAKQKGKWGTERRSTERLQAVEGVLSPGDSHKQLLIAILKYLKKTLKLNLTEAHGTFLQGRKVNVMFEETKCMF